MRLIFAIVLLNALLLGVPSVKAENAPVVDSAVPGMADKVENKKESEIPLNLQAPKKASEDSHPVFKIILIFSMMGLVGTGAYIYLRKYAKNNFAAGKNNQIKILTQHYLGPKKSLAIIRVAGESILIGVTESNINMIKSLALLDDEVPEEVHSSHFSDVFGGVPAAIREESEEEEFSIRGIKEVVSKKLKGMRSFQ
ncbi:MAG: flagellar biosynthetic protein FliO [Pseudobdellovibrionaceae bacterium]